MEPTVVPKLAPYLVARDARGLIRFIETAIGGSLTYEVSDSSGRLAHAEVRVAGGVIMLGEQPAGRNPFPAMLHVYVDNADGAIDRAVRAGASLVRGPGDSGDGLRRGGVRDAWGNEWWFSSPARAGGA